MPEEDAEKDSFTALGEALEQDHRRLDDLWEMATREWREDPQRSRAHFRSFSRGLRTHIQAEEDVLFPFFEEHGGEGAPRLTGLLREEHGRIREALSALLRKVEEGASDLDAESTALQDALWAHNAREEGQLYPWFDAHATRGAAKKVSNEIISRLAGTKGGRRSIQGGVMDSPVEDGETPHGPEETQGGE